jgi:hypothetical protein
VVQLDKSSGAFRRNLPADDQPAKDVTPSRVQPASAAAAGKAK